MKFVMLNKQSRTADKGWFSSLGFGRRANAAFSPVDQDRATLVDSVAWAATAFDFTFTRCAGGDRLNVQLVYKMASRTMVRLIVLLLCRALAKDLRDYSVTKGGKEVYGRPCDGYVATVYCALTP